MSTKKAQATPPAAAVRLAKQLTAESNMKVRWGCDVDEHVYEARVSDRTLRNHGCPVCADGSTDLTAADTIRSFDVNQIGPYSPDEMRVLAARLLDPADHVERGAKETP